MRLAKMVGASRFGRRVLLKKEHNINDISLAEAFRQ